VIAMPSRQDDLFEVSRQLTGYADVGKRKDFVGTLDGIEKITEAFGRSFSGSWLGYHSKVYYKDFAPPPPGARFSQEWGFDPTFGITETRGEWREFDFEQVANEILRQAGHPDIKSLEADARTAEEQLEEAQSTVSSILHEMIGANPADKFLSELLIGAQGLQPKGASDFAQVMMPKGQFVCRDAQAMQSGMSVPPHVSVWARVCAIRYPFHLCYELAKVARRAASHLANKADHMKLQQRVGTRIFLGHGRSTAWRDLKDFLQDRLHLPWDEFNRVPVAGLTNITRLSEMLNNAAMAFIIMTAEDEQSDGDMHARMNVIHEAGLFQGRLGFQRAIILLEQGCREFSNIEGLGQIRFPTGNISAVFEQIREVLEREELLV
jgi:hypothetical protein